MKESIAFTNLPPPALRAWVDVKGPGPGEELFGLILDHTLTGVLTHWMPKVGNRSAYQSAPCVAPPSSCDGCRINRPRQWRGDLGCWVPSNGKLWIAEITAEAARGCQELLRPDRGTLRGRVLKLRRPGRARNGRVHAAVDTAWKQYDALPPPIDTVAQLMRLWGYVGYTVEPGGAIVSRVDSAGDAAEQNGGA